MTRHHRPIVALLALALAAPLAAQDGAWETLESLRASLRTASPAEVAFEQSFRPAGFDSTETESGRMALDLPACLRWDYTDPFPRAFLICGATAWSWNEGESSGRRAFLSPADEPGLDLVRLDVEELRSVYRASLARGTANRREVTLEPLAPGTLRDAVLWTDPEATRLLALAYHDAEGNLTRFEFGEPSRVSDRRRFEPPDLTWLAE